MKNLNYPLEDFGCMQHRICVPLFNSRTDIARQGFRVKLHAKGFYQWNKWELLNFVLWQKYDNLWLEWEHVNNEPMKMGRTPAATTSQQLHQNQKKLYFLISQTEIQPNQLFTREEGAENKRLGFGCKDIYYLRVKQLCFAISLKLKSK